jgi:23S rRNA pseudouridine2605 synthase
LYINEYSTIDQGNVAGNPVYERTKQYLKEIQNAGIKIDGIHYASIDVEIEKLATNSWLQITLHEGKNREIRKVLSYFGLEVNRLIRIQYGNYKLDKMQPGEIKEVKYIPEFENESNRRKL